MAQSFDQHDESVAALRCENEALRSSEAEARLAMDRLQFVLDGSRVGTWKLHLPTKRVHMSATCKAIYGWPPEVEFRREDLIAAIHPDDVAAYQGAVRAAVHDSADLETSYRFTRADGSLRWAEVRGHAIDDANGERLMLSGIVIDATERKRAEARVAEQEARYRAITESIDHMIWSTRPDGFHDFFNHRWYEYTGVPDGSTDGEAWSGLFHPDDRERTRTMWRRCLEAGEPYRIEYRLRHRSGEYRWVLGRAQPVRDAAGTIVRWFGTCTDIHDFKVADQRIRELEERYRLASRASNDAIWDWDLVTGQLRWNENHRALFGHDCEDVTLSRWSDNVHPDDRDRVVKSVRAAIAGDAQRWSADYRFRRADGSYAEVFDRGLIAREADGKALRMIGALQDLTGRSQAEAELRRLAETLEERVAERTAELAASNRQLVGQIDERERVAGTLRQMQRLEAVGQLTSGVAHDFNNLLTVIIGNLGFVQRGVVDTPNAEKLLRRLGFMEAAAERGAKGPDGSPDPSASDATGPTLFTALQDQLGLRLEARKAALDTVVIDHVEQPTEN